MEIRQWFKGPRADERLLGHLGATGRAIERANRVEIARKQKLVIGVALAAGVVIVPERQRFLLAAGIFVGVSSGLVS